MIPKSVLSIIQLVDKYTHIIVGAAAAAVSAVDPHQLPPKFAAAIVLISQGLVVVNGALAKVEAVEPSIAAAPTPDPADPNAPVVVKS